MAQQSLAAAALLQRLLQPINVQQQPFSSVAGPGTQASSAVLPVLPVLPASGPCSHHSDQLPCTTTRLLALHRVAALNTSQADQRRHLSLPAAADDSSVGSTSSAQAPSTVAAAAVPSAHARLLPNAASVGRTTIGHGASRLGSMLENSIKQCPDLVRLKAIVSETTVYNAAQPVTSPHEWLLVTMSGPLLGRIQD